MMMMINLRACPATLGLGRLVQVCGTRGTRSPGTRPLGMHLGRILHQHQHQQSAMSTASRTAEMAERERYPGWNIDLRYTDQTIPADPIYPMGIHPNCVGAESQMLLLREVAMMNVMDRLTDKPDWHKKVFDDTIADKWRQEALAWPNNDLWKRFANAAHMQERHPDYGPREPKDILSKECVDYCIQELRHKAEYFGRTGIVPTLDATHSIAKSDLLVPRELHLELREAFARLRADQANSPDWHPNTNETVLDLVHPSTYPLVYGRSRFLPHEVVGVDDAVNKWAGKGDVIPRNPEWGEEPTTRQTWRWGTSNRETAISESGIHSSYWSTIYQWLPANVNFTDDGGVKFTSYINNLHPTKYRRIYGTIEKLIKTALPMWDQCLAQYTGEMVGPGRHVPRMVPENPDDENPELYHIATLMNVGLTLSVGDLKSIEEMLAREAAAQGAEMTVDQPEVPAKEDGESGTEETGKVQEDWEIEQALEERWHEAREPIQMPPPPFEESKVSYDLGNKTLREQFNKAGLQIIVKMASIELTPEKPELPAGGWHVEGQMNEHIVGTALYYLDSENITDTRLDFRTITSSYQDDDMSIGQDAYHWMQSMYGTSLGAGAGGSCLQNYGSVATPEGRLLAFPNVFQHRVSGFKLADPTKPGHRRFIALWLVDPFNRIISTANVPPQQAEWWADRALGAVKNKESAFPPELAQLLLERGIGASQLGEAIAEGGPGKTKLPFELVDKVRKELGNAFPMNRDEAERHRLKLMGTRSAFQEEARGNWESVEYGFCEH